MMVLHSQMESSSSNYSHKNGSSWTEDYGQVCLESKSCPENWQKCSRSWRGFGEKEEEEDTFWQRLERRVLRTKCIPKKWQTSSETHTLWRQGSRERRWWSSFDRSWGLEWRSRTQDFLPQSLFLAKTTWIQSPLPRVESNRLQSRDLHLRSKRRHRRRSPLEWHLLDSFSCVRWGHPWQWNQWCRPRHRIDQ